MTFEALLEMGDARAHAALGDSCVYTSGSGEVVTVPCIFDAAYRVEDLQQPGVSSSQPAVFVRLSQLPGDPLNDEAARITRAAVTYRIHEVKPDGLGGALLLLNRV